MNSLSVVSLNGQTVLFLKIQFNVSHLFAQCLKVKHFYLTRRYQVLPLRVRVDLWATAMKVYSPKLQSGSHAIGCFNVISGTLVRRRSYLLCRDEFDVFYSPNRLGAKDWTNKSFMELKLYINIFKRYTYLLYIHLIIKIKGEFFQAVFVSVLLYSCTTWTLTKHQQKKLNWNYTRMLRCFFWTNPGYSSLQNSSCTATYLSSRKLFT